MRGTKKFTELVREGRVEPPLLRVLSNPQNFEIKQKETTECSSTLTMERSEKRKRHSVKEVQEHVQDGERNRTQYNLQKTIKKFHKEHSLREIDPEFADYFHPDYMVKGVIGDGACFYRALVQEIWGTPENWAAFRQICHNYIIAWCDHYTDFLVFPREITIGVSGMKKELFNLHQYKEFLKTEESLYSFVEDTVEHQIVASIFNAKLNIFYYNYEAEEEAITRGQDIGWRTICPNQNLTQYSNHKGNDQLEVTLYYNQPSHYEVIVRRPHDYPGVAARNLTENINYQPASQTKGQNLDDEIIIQTSSPTTNSNYVSEQSQIFDHLTTHEGTSGPQKQPQPNHNNPMTPTHQTTTTRTTTHRTAPLPSPPSTFDGHVMFSDELPSPPELHKSPQKENANDYDEEPLNFFLLQI